MIKVLAPDEPLKCSYVPADDLNGPRYQITFGDVIVQVPLARGYELVDTLLRGQELEDQMLADPNLDQLGW